MHEHIFLISPEVEGDFPDLVWNTDRDERVEQAAGELQALKSRGIDTIVDLTVPGLGRCIDAVQAVAERIDLNIVAATGWYTFDRLPTPISTRRPGRGPQGRVEDVMTDLFLRDIRDGIAGTNVRAAVLKCCTDKQGVTRGIDRTIRAIAWAHRDSGVPISTHTNASCRTGLDQQRVFAEEGVDLTRVVIGHCGDTDDLDYLRTLMDRGSTIGCDRFGYYTDGSPGPEARLDVVAELCRLGYSDRLVLGHDAHCHADWHHEENPLDGLSDWKFTHIPDDVLPALLQRGVTEDEIRQMLVDTPRRLFELVTPY